ncbi:MAG: hypothetical protein IIC54_09465, partial [Proteobacteria bacterium]|nr:hypothetical protein [Pseudomonadota bacterium]
MMLAARAIFAFLGCALSVTAQAHGFAERYDLPVPLHLYLAGSAAAVALSFVVVAYFVRGDRTVQRYPTFNLLGTSAGRILASRMVRFVLQLFTVFMLVLVVVAGFIGDTDPFKNIAPTTVWVIWWVGFAYISGMLGDLWALLNPWRTVFEGAQWLFAKLQSGKRLGLNRDYPEKLASWPAAILFVWFIWAELIWPASDTPAELSQMVLTYSVITWVGMFTFGSRNWLRHGEVFTVLFGLLARLAPTEYLAERQEWKVQVLDSGEGIFEEIKGLPEEKIIYTPYIHHTGEDLWSPGHRYLLVPMIVDRNSKSSQPNFYALDLTHGSLMAFEGLPAWSVRHWLDEERVEVLTSRLFPGPIQRGPQPARSAAI